MVTAHLPWKFHENRSSRFLVILLTLKQRKKSPANNSPFPYQGRGKNCWLLQPAFGKLLFTEGCCLVAEYCCIICFRYDLLSILTEVNRAVSEAATRDGNFKQVPAPTSTLTKRVYFWQLVNIYLAVRCQAKCEFRTLRWTLLLWTK